MLQDHKKKTGNLKQNKTRQKQKQKTTGSAEMKTLVV